MAIIEGGPCCCNGGGAVFFLWVLYLVFVTQRNTEVAQRYAEVLKIFHRKGAKAQRVSLQYSVFEIRISGLKLDPCSLILDP